METELRAQREKARLERNHMEYRRLSAIIRYKEKPEHYKKKMAEYRSRLTPGEKQAQYLYSKANIESDPAKLARRRAQAKKWRDDNPEKFRASVRKCRQNPYYNKKRLWDMKVLSFYAGHFDPKDAPRRGKKPQYHYPDIFGCSPAEFRAHMGERFDGCQLDHIIPASRFDLTTEAGLKLAYHYTNLRWVAGRVNALKAAR